MQAATLKQPQLFYTRLLLRYPCFFAPDELGKYFNRTSNLNICSCTQGACYGGGQAVTHRWFSQPIRTIYHPGVLVTVTRQFECVQCRLCRLCWAVVVRRFDEQQKIPSESPLNFSWANSFVWGFHIVCRYLHVSWIRILVVLYFSELKILLICYNNNDPFYFGGQIPNIYCIPTALCAYDSYSCNHRPRGRHPYCLNM